MRHILVTGGGSTLGEAIVRYYIEAGDRVWATYYQQKDRLEALKEETGPSLQLLELDVTDEGSVDRAIGSLDRLDVLVNNSGIFTESLVADLSLAEWQRVFAVNVEGVFLLSRRAIPLLQASSGAIVNIASINAFIPTFSKTVHYDASKAAVIGFTQSLAAELAPQVRVNAVAPGLLAAPHLDRDHPLRQRYEQRSPLGKLVDAKEVAKVVGLLSDCGDMTGQTVVVDGGYTIG